MAWVNLFDIIFLLLLFKTEFNCKLFYCNQEAESAAETSSETGSLFERDLLSQALSDERGMEKLSYCNTLHYLKTAFTSNLKFRIQIY